MKSYIYLFAEHDSRGQVWIFDTKWSAHLGWWISALGGREPGPIMVSNWEWAGIMKKKPVGDPWLLKS